MTIFVPSWHSEAPGRACEAEISPPSAVKDLGCLESKLVIDLNVSLMSVFTPTFALKPSKMVKIWSVVFHLLFLLGAAPPRDEAGGEFPPLSPDEFLSLSDGPAVTLKSEFSLDIRKSSCQEKQPSASPGAARNLLGAESGLAGGGARVTKHYLELVQVGGALPVLIVTDTGHPGEADGYSISRVHLRFGELGSGDLPDWRLLWRSHKTRSRMKLCFGDRQI